MKFKIINYASSEKLNAAKSAIINFHLPFFAHNILDYSNLYCYHLKKVKTKSAKSEVYAFLYQKIVLYEFAAWPDSYKARNMHIIIVKTALLIHADNLWEKRKNIK